MKNKLFIYVGLAASLLCSCAQSDVDNGQGQSQGNTVLHLTTTAPGAGSDTRVSVSEDFTNGLITKWTSSDQLNVYNLYNSSSLTNKSFTNSLSADAQTTDFTNSGSNNIFTPGSIIYAFNNLVSGSNGSYAQTNSGSTFTLTLSGYDKQNGTLANMAQYDALCGTTTAKMDGVNGNLMMNHLTAAMCFNFINADFATGTTLTKFAVNCESTAKSILPVSCTATLGADGNITFGTPVGTTNWTAVPSTSIPAANGAIKVYLMTFPFKNISGSLEFIAKTSANKYYWRKVNNMNGLNLSAGFVQNRPVNMTLINLPHYGDILQSAYFEWDANVYYKKPGASTAFSSTGYGNNTTTTIGTGKIATISCKDCPTAKEIYAYLLAGAYLDPGDPILMDDGSYSYPPSYTGLVNGTTTGATTTYNDYDPFTHALASGSSKGNGLWLPKNAYIKSTLSSTLGWGSTNGVADYTGGIGTVGANMLPSGNIVTTAALATSIRNSGNYFYLPASGNGSPDNIGIFGNWWSSSTYSAAGAYDLHFEGSSVSLSNWARTNPFTTWSKQ